MHQPSGARSRQALSLVSPSSLLRPSPLPPSSSIGDLRENDSMPHKIFVWDPNGVYMDCVFPNPIYGHFLGPANLKGVHVRDVFSRSVGVRMLKMITGAWKLRTKQFTNILFERHGQRYEAAVVCSVTQEGAVIGIVTDRLLDVPAEGDPQPMPVVQNQGEALMTLAGQVVTVRQYRIVREVIAGCTNEEIAGHFGITERTVKSHLQKIYRKLDVVNRNGLMVRLLQANSPGRASELFLRPDPP